MRTRTDFKNINKINKSLANGDKKTYFYYGRGRNSQRLTGEPGTPEFLSSYLAAKNKQTARKEQTLQFLLEQYQSSMEFQILSPRTRKDYIKHILSIEHEFGDFPIAGLSNIRCRTIFLEWRDTRAHLSRRQADYGLTVLARILSWSLNRALISHNHLQNPGKLYKTDRSYKTWSFAQEKAFLDCASEEVFVGYLLAVYTMQRQGDILHVEWSNYDGNYIRLVQQKTKESVTVPVVPALREVLDALPRRGRTILATKSGGAYTSDGFRSLWHRTQKAAGVSGVSFHDIRGTSATRFLIAGNEFTKVAAWGGWSTQDLRSIERYIDRMALAESKDFANCAANYRVRPPTSEKTKQKNLLIF